MKDQIYSPASNLTSSVQKLARSFTLEQLDTQNNFSHLTT